MSLNDILAIDAGRCVDKWEYNGGFAVNQGITNIEGKAYRGVSIIRKLIMKMEKSGSPTSNPWDKVRIKIRRRNQKDDGYEEVYNFLIAEFGNPVWGGSSKDPDIAVSNWDDTNKSCGLSLRFPRGIYCPYGWKIIVDNESAISGDNWLGTIVVWHSIPSGRPA